MDWFWITYTVLISLYLLWIAIIGLRFRGSLKNSPVPDRYPSITTIVPARNEERNIGRCASGLTQQDYNNLEMVFVDDASTDRTPDILEQYETADTRVKVVHTEPRPEGWNGKQWACHSGYLLATGDWLCFIDADTYAEPDLLSKTIAYAIAHNVDFLTLQPWYEIKGIWERIVLPETLIPLFAIFPPDLVNSARSRMAIANGQFILIRRSVYEAIDGHVGVRGRMMDDFPLAQNTKKAGFCLHMVDGSEVMRVRLYTNLKEIWAGGLKAAVEITSGWIVSTLIVLANILINVVPWVLFVWALIAGNQLAAYTMGFAVLSQIIYFGSLRMIAFRAPPWTSVFHPIGSLIGGGILIDGMIRLASGRAIKWKDRPVIGGPELDVKGTLKRQKR